MTTSLDASTATGAKPTRTKQADTHDISEEN